LDQLRLSEKSPLSEVSLYLLNQEYQSLF